MSPSILALTIRIVFKFNVKNRINKDLSSPSADFPPKRMEDDIDKAIKKTKAKILARTKPKPKPRSSRLQLATYKSLVEHVDLLNPEIPDDERFRRAKRLIRAYERVRKRRPNFRHHSKQLLAALSIVNRHNYQKRKKRAVSTPAPGN